VNPDNAKVHVIAGSSNGVTGAITRAVTEPLYLDIHLPAGSTFSTAVPEGHNAFIYVYRGAVNVEGVEVASQRMGIFHNTAEADGVTVTAGMEPARLILVAGKPLNEPIVQYGPFVMNTQQQIRQALEDFHAGRF
jgi:redox-sensitive bicupin YhaK (pirin superfamily)